jgi:hypothetical protein
LRGILVRMLLRSIRRRLRLIRYYSAARPYGRWSKARDAAMAAALLLAWPLTWLIDRAWVTRSNRVVITGFLYRQPGGQLFALTTTTSGKARDPTGDADFYGAYLIDLTDEERGWPFASSSGLRGGTINVELFEEGLSLGAADLPRASPVRAAIEQELNWGGQGAAASAVWGNSTVPAVTTRPGAWLANGILWSLALVIAAWPLVGAARLTAAFLSAGRAARRRHLARRGRCAGCGYDLRGSPFGERCPECGALL